MLKIIVNIRGTANKNFVIVIVSMMALCLLGLNSCSPVDLTEKNKNDNSDMFLLSSQSPDESYLLEAYRTEPGATVDFSVKVYIVTDAKIQLIYDAYHEYSAEIIWLENDIVSINGRVLNLAKDEKYDWRKY